MARVYQGADLSVRAATKKKTRKSPEPTTSDAPADAEQNDSQPELEDSNAPSAAENDDDTIGHELQQILDGAGNGESALKKYAALWRDHRTRDGTSSKIEGHARHGDVARAMLRNFYDIYAQKGVTNKDIRSNVNIISSEKFEWHQEVGPLQYYAIFGPCGLSRTFMERFRALASMRSHTDEAGLDTRQADKGLTFGQALTLLLEARTQRMSAAVGVRGSDKHAEWQCHDCHTAAEMARERFGMVSAQKPSRKRKKTPEAAEADAGNDADGRAQSEERCDSVNGEGNDSGRLKKRRLNDKDVNGTTSGDLENADVDEGVASPEIGRSRESALPDESDADLGLGGSFSEDDTGGFFDGGDDDSINMGDEALQARFRFRKQPLFGPLFGPGSAGLPAAVPGSSRFPTQATRQRHSDAQQLPSELDADQNLPDDPPPPPSPPIARVSDAATDTDADAMPPALKRHAVDALASARPRARAKLAGAVTRFKNERLAPHARNGDGSQGVQLAQPFLAAFASVYGYSVDDSHSRSRRTDQGGTTAEVRDDTGQNPFVTVHSQGTSTTPFYLVILRSSLAGNEHPADADAEPRWLVSCLQLGGPEADTQITALCSTGALSQENRAHLRNALLTALPPERASDVNAIPLESYAVEALPTSADTEDHDPTDLVKSVAVAACMIADTRTESHISIWAWVGAMSVVLSPPSSRITEFETWVELPAVLAAALKTPSPAAAHRCSLDTIAAGLAMFTAETADIDKETQAVQRYVEELQRIRASIETMERESRAAPDPANLELLDRKIRTLETTVQSLRDCDEDTATIQAALERIQEQRRQAAQLTPTVPKSLRDCRVWADMSVGAALSEVQRSEKQRQDMFAQLEEMLRPAMTLAQTERARPLPR
ncbi:hypothetical protein AC578_9848 [Pseudocercospora eumusae]|uniref:Uncharacterized protein n=1 Tax=Pseudocercospora eumusae TaxID=321146 RepID=A0A139HB56_9PEZI|nr:hypothetical protein AC578_9848 [Pseudocercospora eumusae]